MQQAYLEQQQRRNAANPFAAQVRDTLMLQCCTKYTVSTLRHVCSYGAPVVRPQSHRPAELLNNSDYSSVYGTIKDNLARKGHRPPAEVDPQDLTAAHTLSPEALVRLGWKQLQGNTKEALRDHALGTGMLSGVAAAGLII
jgi:hypothetical protein